MTFSNGSYFPVGHYSLIINFYLFLRFNRKIKNRGYFWEAVIFGGAGTFGID